MMTHLVVAWQGNPNLEIWIREWGIFGPTQEFIRIARKSTLSIYGDSRTCPSIYVTVTSDTHKGRTNIKLNIHFM